jgi:hypothetical protein
VLLAVLRVVPAASAEAANGQPFGIASFDVATTRIAPGSGPGGVVQQAYAYTQAGGHPQALTSSIEFGGEPVEGGLEQAPAGEPKDLTIEMPPGLTANPLAVSRCPLPQALENHCTSDAQVGVYSIALFNGKALFGPIYDVTPEAGQAAELVADISGADLIFTGRLTRTAAGYGLAILAHGLSPLGMQSAQITLWGVPADPVHDPQRGLVCNGEAAHCEGGDQPAQGEPAPFLTLGSDCAAGGQTASAWAHSWEEPQSWVRASASMPALSGCNLLAFAPTLQASWEGPLADEGSGMALQIQAPQIESATTNSAPPLREATVTLPQGASIDPAALAGVRACAASGAEGIDIPSGVDAAGQPLNPEAVGEGEEAGPDGLKRLAGGHCPEASIIGSVEAQTPLLRGSLSGAVYLAQPLCGGAGQSACTEADAAEGRLARVYLELASAGEPGPEGFTPSATQAGSVMVVKLAGEIGLDPATGQPSLHILHAPQLPIEDLRIALNGGPGALLATPAACGIATTTSELTPWSASGLTPEGLFVPGTPEASPSSFTQIGGCQPASKFSPGFSAGTIEPLGGAASALTLSVTRNDREPYLGVMQMTLPPGLTARLAGVPLCPSASASTGACPAAAQVGAATVEAGAGSDPLLLRGGIYLTGPYEGAPFGLAIVVPGAVGPFDLGAIVVRARVEIDPRTAAITILSDRLPQIVLGVPLRLRRISLEIDRRGFILNPTGCGARRIAGTVEGLPASAGSGPVFASVASPFAASRCKELPFAPRISLATGAGRTHRDGAMLAAEVRGGAGQANLSKLSLQLPKRLAVRGSTLAHTCEAARFASNPASCPPASVIGTAKVATPMLSRPLLGPVIFVAEGRKRVPGLRVLLQGEGVQLELAARTQITRQGYTFLRFEGLPDVPISSIALRLPSGPASALTPNGSLCRGGIAMPAAFAGQNGAEVKRMVRVAVKGCGASRRRSPLRQRGPALSVAGR